MYRGVERRTGYVGSLCLYVGGWWPLDKIFENLEKSDEKNHNQNLSELQTRLRGNQDLSLL